MNTLEQYGWNEFFSNYHSNSNVNADYQIGRVISIKGLTYQLISLYGEIAGELSGKFLYGRESDLLPQVGDWVYFVRYDTQGYIVELFPRQNALLRRTAGKASKKQLLAANIDYALIVQGLDRDFNIMRLDRYLVQTMACGIKPFIVLNKVDLIQDRTFFLNEISRLSKNCPVCFCTTNRENGLDEFYKSALQPGKTHVLIGSSGVGKSSILNRLKTDREQKTAHISESTNKGRHTTTTRELFLLSDGSMLIDTPGMREFGIALDDDLSHSGFFPVIDDLANHCRYSDCLHTNEEGCAVLDALRDGTLDAKLYSSYIKLIKEQQHFDARVEDKKRSGRRFGKILKNYQQFKKNNNL